jgi:replicative DNA helicase
MMKDTPGFGIPAISTGVASVDAITDGLSPGHLVIVAGPASHGKTSLALSCTISAAFDRALPVAYFATGMTGQEITTRILSARARVPFWQLATDDLEDADRDRVSRHRSELSHSGLRINDDANLSVSEITSIARQQQEDPGLGLVVVDSLSLLTGPYPEVIEAATLDLKKLATTRRITVLATIDFSGWKGGELPRRALEQSGFLEHSDIALLMHSHGDDSPRAGETDVVTAKHRYRATGETATAVFVQKYGRFMDMPPGGLNG